MDHIIAVIIVLAALVLVVARSRSTHFECPKYGHSFKVSGLIYALSPHFGGKRYIKCPNCNERAMMFPIGDIK